jgi:hypothetical protein
MDIQREIRKIDEELTKSISIRDYIEQKGLVGTAIYYGNSSNQFIKTTEVSCGQKLQEETLDYLETIERVLEKTKCKLQKEFDSL